MVGTREQMGSVWTQNAGVPGTELIQTEPGLSYSSLVQRVVSQPKFMENMCVGVCLKTTVVSVIRRSNPDATE